ncbi:MAG TPA: DoxX family membrane protein [Clostridia bacterium]|nr:DoxX family membrane protein [Clostridia bacterium]
MKIFKHKGFTVVWTILRVWLGYNWLMSGIEKLRDPAWVGSEAGTAISGFFQGSIANSAGQYATVPSWYAGFIERFAMPFSKIFTYLIPIGETLVGISLILGALTLLGLLGSALMNFNYLLAGAGGINTMMYTVAILLLVAGSAAYYIGLDKVLVFPILRRFFKFMPEEGQ